MNPNELRATVEEVVKDILPKPWEVTTKTFVTLEASYTCQIGHLVQIRPDTYKGGSIVATLTVTLWANEANEEDAVDKLYEQLSTDPGALYGALLANRSFREVLAGNVGPRDAGPTGYLAADITMTLRGVPETIGS